MARRSRGGGHLPMTDETFQKLIERETKPKHKTFFGKIFDPSAIAQKFSVHTLPQYKLFCGVEKNDHKGLYIPELSRVWEGHSLLANWYNQLRSVTFAINGNDGGTWNDGYINYKGINDTVTSQNSPIVWSLVDGYMLGTTTSTQGIQLGTGNTAVTERDWKLATLILAGNTAGKLNYAAATGNVSYDSTNKIWQIDVSRPFTGNAADAVVVAEMGLVLAVHNTKYMMTARDLVDPTEEVSIAEAVTFHYILQQINPA